MNSKQRFNKKRMAAFNSRKAAEASKDIRLEKAISVCLIGSQRVAKALTLIDGPAAPRAKQEDCGAMCLPQVALYAAGHRKTRKDAVHIIK